MNESSNSVLPDKFTFSSSVGGDVWHSHKDPKAYEWWYFDALSDDGREAIVITFLDNFIYSPRYNKPKERRFRGTNDTEARQRLFPAVAVAYFRDGQVRYRTVAEFDASEFHASVTEPEVRIGDCTLSFRTETYGSGYHIQIDVALTAGRRLKANFEWLAIEADFLPDKACFDPGTHCWNMAAPRCDVTGKVEICGRRGTIVETFQFRGTGYHDHKLDNRWLAKTVRDWHWGRAHFADSSAVFYRYRENGDDRASTKLIVVSNGELMQSAVEFEEQNYVRNKFGIRYPTRLRLIAEDDVRLTVKPLKVIDASFFYLRFLSEMTMILPDGEPHVTTGITEFLTPKALNYRWVTWLGDVRTGKNGRGPLIG